MSRSISGGIVRDICIAELASSIKTSPVPLVLRNALNLQPPWITVITDENDDMDTISISSSSSSSSSSPTAFLRSRCADARVSVSVSADSAFRGSVYDNERIDVRFDEFLDRFDAAFFDKENTENSNKRTASSYYLAQCSIQSQSTSAPLSMLADDVSRAASSLIDAFGSATLLESNLWMSLDAATTSPHFDENHGLLCVLHGVKNVRLASPARTAAYRPHSVAGAAANHTRLLSDDSCFEFSVDVAAGDCLFIPENWWHSVRSSRCSVAINFWFEGRATQLVNSDMNCARSVCRRVLRELVDTRIADLLRSLDEQTSDDVVPSFANILLLCTDSIAQARLLRRLDAAALAEFVAAANAADEAQFARLFDRMAALSAKVLVDAIEQHAKSMDVDALVRFFARVGGGDEREGEKRLMARGAALGDKILMERVMSEEFGVDIEEQ